MRCSEKAAAGDQSSEEMKFDWLESRLAALFSSHIKVVCRWPAVYIAVPLAATFVFSFGLLRFDAVVKDDLSLYTPSDAAALKELQLLERLFPINDSDPYYAVRRYDNRRSGYVIVTSANASQQNVLSLAVAKATVRLWRRIETMPVEDNGTYSYRELCVRATMPLLKTNACVSNPLIELYRLVERSRPAAVAEQILTALKYPLTRQGWLVGHLIGGVALNASKFVVGAKAFLLPYQLRHSSVRLDRVGELWEKKFESELSEFRSSEIRVNWWTFETLAGESARDRRRLVDMTAPMVVVILVFSVLCCCEASWTRSKPWLALAGVSSAGAAVISAVGLLLLANYPFTSVAYTVPFVIFAIGVDNVFILLSAWRRTPARPNCVESRMSLTFRDAAVSITLTSLTDALSFAVGATTPFPSVRIFCVYAALAVFFVYVYQLTLFAGLMVLTSRRELANRSCLTFRRLKNAAKVGRSAAKGAESECVRSIDGGANWARARDGHCNPEDNNYGHDHPLARCFRSFYADVLLNPFVRTAVIGTFILYILVAAWACTQMKLGLRLVDLLPDNSYGKESLEALSLHFPEAGFPLHVTIWNLVEYQQRADDSLTAEKRGVVQPIWLALEREISLYEHTEFTGYADSWLRSFLAYCKSSTSLPPLSKRNFISLLRTHFLTSPLYGRYARDVAFDESGRYLSAVRFPVQMRFVHESNQSAAMGQFRRMAASSSDFNVSVYANFFLFAEQYDAVLPATLRSVAMAGAAVVFVSLLLIPKPLCAFWVALTIGSINLGTLGFMALWNVRLDFVSMLTVVMSIGLVPPFGTVCSLNLLFVPFSFCVDFAAHLAYHFAKSLCCFHADSSPPSERLRQTLRLVGTPIVQSALSTVLGVSFLAAVESYVFRSFFKTIILVVVLGAYHGLVVLPVMLTALSVRPAPSEGARDSWVPTERRPAVNIYRLPPPPPLADW